MCLERISRRKVNDSNRIKPKYFSEGRSDIKNHYRIDEAGWLAGRSWWLADVQIYCTHSAFLGKIVDITPY